MKKMFTLLVAAALTCIGFGTALAATGWGYTPGSVHPEISIYNFQQNGLQVGWPQQGDTLRMTGKIITAFDLKPGSYGFWIQEPGAGPWGGVMVYTGTSLPTAPPSGPALKLGDIVTVTGIYTEFPTTTVRSVTEINTGAAASGFGWGVTVTGHTTPPSAQKVSPGLIRWADSTCAEQWEGSLIRIDSVTCYKKYNYNRDGFEQNGPGTLVVEMVVQSTNQGPNGRTICNGGSPGYGIPGAPDTCRVDDKFIINGSPSDTATWPLAGTQFKSVTGIVSQEFNSYKIWPRDLNNDLQFVGAPPGPNLVRAYAISNTQVEAVFSVPVDDTTGQDAGNYVMLNSGVTAAVRQADQTKVRLTVSPAMVPGTPEQLTVASISTETNPHGVMTGTDAASFRAGISTIVQIQTPGALHDTSQYNNEVVTINGIVTAGTSTYPSSPGATFIMDNDNGTPYYDGVELFSPILTIARGDNVTVAGSVQEFNNKTEISSIAYMVINSSGNAEPTPHTPTISQLAIGLASGLDAEKYEGTLIKMSGTTATDTIGNPAFSWRMHNSAGDTLRVAHDGVYSWYATPYDQVTICGVLDSFSSQFRLQPRTIADLFCGSSPAGVGDNAVAFALHQSTPNPFARSTSIRFSIPRFGKASLNVYNVGGQKVRTLVDGMKNAGPYSVNWDGRGDNGATVSSGIYYYRLNTGGQTLTKKLVLSR